MINNDISIQYDTLQHRLNACREMYDSGSKSESKRMLMKLAKEILDDGRK